MAYFQGVGSAVGKKYGPLPAWGWLGLFAVGAYLYQRNKGGSGAARPETVLPGQSSYYSTISNVNYPPPGPNPEPQPIPGPAACPPGTTWGRDPTSDRTSFSCVPINSEDRECPPGQHMECGPGDSPCVCVNNHIRGPLPPVDSDGGPPTDFGPARPGGGPLGVQAPRGLVGGLVRLPAVAASKVRAQTPRAIVGAVAGQRMISFKPSVRPALRAAQRATEDAPGLVGLTALEGPLAGRGRSTMPPAPALRQRPAPPRIVDNESQRNVKHQVTVGG